MSRVVVNEIEAKVGNDITFNDTVKISTAQIDTVRGKTTAGSVTVQGEGTNTTNLQQGLNKAWFRLGVDATFHESFNSSSVDDDGSGDYGVHFTNNFSNSVYVSSHMMETDGLNPRMMIQSPDKATGAVELRILNANDGSANEGNINGAEMQICGDLA